MSHVKSLVSRFDQLGERAADALAVIFECRPLRPQSVISRREPLPSLLGRRQVQR